MIEDRENLSEETILETVERRCLSFVPTADKLAELRRSRPGLSPMFETRMEDACLLSVDFETAADLRWLAARRPADAHATVRRDLASCPADLNRRELRGVTQAGAEEGLIVLLGERCGIDVSQNRWELVFRGGYAPLSAASEIRAEGMTFHDGWELAAGLAFSPDRRARFALDLAATAYDFASPDLSFQTAGDFRLWAGSLGARYFISCLWRPHCGGYVWSADDVYLQASASYNLLEGTVHLAGDPPFQGDVYFDFHGPGAALGAGYVRRLHRVVDLSLEVGYGWIQFGNVSIESFGATFSDRVTGVSKRPRFTVSLTTAIPL